MKRTLKRGISILIVLTMTLCTNVSVFASGGETIETAMGKLSVIPISDDFCLLTDGDSTAVLKVEARADEYKMQLSGTDNDGYFIINPETHALYSSFTGKTLNFIDNSKSSYESDITPFAVGDIKETYTMKISYKDIANAIGTATGTYDLAFAIAGIFAAAQGIAIATIPVLIYGGLKGIVLETILNGVRKGLPGGVKVTINLVEIERHQGGNIVVAYSYKLRSLTTYS